MFASTNIGLYSSPDFYSVLEVLYGLFLQTYVWVLFFFPPPIIQRIINHAKATCLATTKVGFESKYKEDIWCDLRHFD